MWSKKSTCFVLSHSKKLAVCIILLDRGIKGSCRKLDQWKICCNLRFSFLGDCLLFCRDNSIPLLFSHPYQHHPQVLVPWLISLFYNTLEYVQSFPSISLTLFLPVPPVYLLRNLSLPLLSVQLCFSDVSMYTTKCNGRIMKKMQHCNLVHRIILYSKLHEKNCLLNNVHELVFLNCIEKTNNVLYTYLYKGIYSNSRHRTFSGQRLGLCNPVFGLLLLLKKYPLILPPRTSCIVP